VRVTGQFIFIMLMFVALGVLYDMPGGPRHPARTTVLDRKPGECKCPGNFMCVECQKQPVDKICRCEPTKADYDKAEAAYRSMVKDFQAILNITPPD